MKDSRNIAAQPGRPPRALVASAGTIARRFGPGRGFLLGAAAWTSEDEKALNTLLNDSFDRVFQKNWPLLLAPLTRDQIKTIIRAAMYYYGLGYSVQDWKRDEKAGGFRQRLQKSLPQFKPADITKVLAFLSRINQNEFPGDYALLTRGHASAEATEQQQQQQSAQRRQEIAYEIQDKIKRGTGAIASTAVESASLVNAALPWYMRPTTLLMVAAVGAVGYFALQKKGASIVRKAISYKRNPVESDELEDGARRIYKRFNGFNPKKVIELDHINTEHVAHLGDVLELGYRSNKWTGKKANYLHEFGKGVKLYATADGKALIITGGKMRVEDVGIVN